LHQHFTRRVIAAAAVLSVALVLTPRQPAAQPESAIEYPAQESVPRILADRLAVKRRLAREVAAGQRPLAEAAALFAALNRVPPAVPVPDPVYLNDTIPLPTRTPAEKACWQVASWVNGLDAHRRRGQPPATERLAAEVERMIRDHGAVRLPEVPEGAVEGLLREAATD
jgi:hypothetical protein